MGKIEELFATRKRILKKIDELEGGIADLEEKSLEKIGDPEEIDKIDEEIL